MVVGIIIAVVVALAVIIALKAYVPTDKITREEFLAKLEEHVGGERVPIEGMENSFQVPFSFEGNDFIYEDIEVMGFRGKVQKVHLKHQMGNQLSLNFTEENIGAIVRSDILIVSEINEESLAGKPNVSVPKSLSGLAVQTNNVNLANKLFENSKAVSILSGYKNVDERGRPFMSLRIIEGMISLHFHSTAHYKPSLHNLMSELPSLETYLDKIIVIAKALN